VAYKHDSAAFARDAFDLSNALALKCRVSIGQHFIDK